MRRNIETQWITPSVNRRTFVKVSGTLASVAVASRVFNPSTSSEAAAAGVPILTGESLPDEIESAEDIIYSVCQMCHSRCGIRAKVKEGILVKLDGNPYHPNNRDVDENNDPDRVPYGTPPEQAFTELGRLCLDVILHRYRDFQTIDWLGRKRCGSHTDGRKHCG